ncbi:MAG TPA: glycoside hydrolase family 88 protein [Ruminiclostridium sp.]
MKKVNVDLVNKVKSGLLCLQRYQWEQGCAAQAILEWDGFNEEVVQLCRAAVIRKNKDGRIGIMEKNESVDDPAAIGEALILSAKNTGNEELQKAADKLYFYMKNRAPKTIDGILYHFNIKNEVWVDAYYMACPFFAAYGDFEEAMKQLKGFRKYLFDENKQLHSHIWDDDINDFQRKAFWGVGNGWAAAGVTRIIKMLPEDRAEDKAYCIDFVKKIIDGVLVYQREDGLFHDVLDDSLSFVETNVGQQIAYSIYRGVAAGYIDKSYLKHADKIREAAYEMVDKDGFVMGVCAAPTFDYSGMAPEGQAFFILMEAAARELFGQ